MKLATHLARTAAVAAALVALQGVAFADTYSSFSSGASGFTTETESVVNAFLKPMAPAGSTVSSYSVLSTASGYSATGMLTFAEPITSYTFLWGSPDAYNTVSDGKVSVTGASFSSGKGNNAESTLYTFVDPAGFSSLTLTTAGIAFEVAAVTPVPEPETYALMLGGLGVLGLLARRRRAA